MKYIIVEEFDGFKIKAVVREREIFRLFKKVDVCYSVCDDGFIMGVHRNPSKIRKLRKITSVKHAVSIIEEWREAPEKFANFQTKVYNEKGQQINEKGEPINEQ